MDEIKSCPNCAAPIKGGIWNANQLIEVEISRSINHFTENKADAHCQRCFSNLLAEAKEKQSSIYPELLEKLEYLLSMIPVLTINSPFRWEYEAIEMVTAQSVTGTGVITEIASGWTDFFSGQSDRMSGKLKLGENTCIKQLRYEAATLGANAIIGTDIDYAEVGGDKGMLMVCMTGTAVMLKNIEILNGRINKDLEALKELIEEVELCKFVMSRY